MTEHKVATREEWQTARDELLVREKELTRRSDELAREREEELPWVPVDKEYSFDTEGGTKTLAEPFDGRSQLMIYTFMFGPTYEAGCPVCSSGADTYNGALPHLNARDVTFTCVSRGPLDRLLAFRHRMGWSLPWASSGETGFNSDFGAVNSEEALRPFLESGNLGPVPQLAAACGVDPAAYVTEAPTLHAFAHEDGVVYHTYSTTARGLEPLLSYYGILDRAPRGRNESGAEPPWIRRHDEY
jgi:predicted dithiol-disulfide oxidoreductase (DUF899 family)